MKEKEKTQTSRSELQLDQIYFMGLRKLLEPEEPRFPGK